MRTFIAIDLDDGVKSKAIELLARLRKSGKTIKWVGRQALHLTLKFLGEIDENKVPDIDKVLASAAEDSRPFPLRMKGTGCFPPGSRTPRVLWLGLEAGPELFSLQESLEKGLESLGFEREQRPFHSHITLGRVKVPAPLPPDILRIFDAEKDTVFGEMTVTKFIFFRSILKPEGPEYHILSEYRFP